MNRRAASILWPAAALAVIVWLIPQAVFAHGFGEKYDLPVPLTFFVTGAGLAVALSFIIVAVFVRRTPSATDYPRFDLLRLRPVRVLASGPVVQALRIAAVLILLLVLLTGALGINRSTVNIAPVLVWVYWWVGIAFASALLGNVWGLINPGQDDIRMDGHACPACHSRRTQLWRGRLRIPTGLGRMASRNHLCPIRMV